MERGPRDGKESSRIDVKVLPDSVARLWETMLRLDPNWDFLQKRVSFTSIALTVNIYVRQGPKKVVTPSRDMLFVRGAVG